MSALTINCALPCDRLMRRQRNVPLVLQRIDGSEDQSLEAWVVNEVECMRFHQRSAIFRANLKGHSDGELSIVLKMDPTGLREDEFLREAGAYGSGAKLLQGSIIPRYYGCFVADTGRQFVTCMVLEDCGKSLTAPFLDLDWDIK